MKSRVLSLLAAVASLVIVGGNSSSAATVTPCTASILSASPYAGGDVVEIAGPASASYSVVYFDEFGRGQEVASGSLSGNGDAAVLTPQIGVGMSGVSYVEIHVRVSGGDVYATQVVDPLFLWQ